MFYNYNFIMIVSNNYTQSIEYYRLLHDNYFVIVDEGRGKKKKQLKKKLKILIPLAILGKIKAIALVVFALLVIAASVFKLAVIAKIAFIAKVIAIIKALIAKKHAQEDHGWAPPHEEHVHAGGSGWEGGWSRSRNEANSLAYSAYQQQLPKSNPVYLRVC